ncbi:aminotransferase class I/II-fold pyridoxal phosphate-dependent enzyme [bacterium]|nr:MAG: aminotransferase class I/II-fold pyridoxal phosphate-dependent enzyme [bacterium]
MRGIAQLAIRHDFWIVADEIYERLVYGGAKVTSIAALVPEAYDRTLTINGVSKTYAMTGWRLGYCAAPEPVAKAMATLQDAVTSNPTSFVQDGAIAALALPDADIEAMRVEFEARRTLIVEGLNAIPGFRCGMPGGAFYAFPDVSGALRPGEDDLEFAAALLAEAEVAVVPGSVFEGAGHIRLSYATSRETIAKGLDRIDAFVRGRR